MPNITNNFGLTKPLPEEFYDINVHNENMDKIDGHSHESFNNNVSMSGNRITDVANPTARTDVATKGYVDDAIPSKPEDVGAARENHTHTASDVGAVPVCQGVVTSSADLNDFRTEGTYFFSDSYTHSNIPTNNVNGWLDVKVYGNGIKQIWYRFGTPGQTDHETFVRTHAPSTGWGEWVKVLTSKDTCIATYSTKDLTPGTSALETGKLYFVYE